MASNSGTYASFRYREFLYYTISRFAAALGSQIQGVAVGWQVYDRTHSALALGMIGLVMVIPGIGLSLIAGHIADRRDRRKILLMTQTAQWCCSLGLVAASALDARSVMPIYVVLFFSGVAYGFQGPANSALMPQLIPPEVYPNAVTWRTTTFQVSALVGPLIGGRLLAWHLNPVHAYMADATTGAISLALLLGIRARTPEPHDTREGMWRSLIGGVHFVWNRPVILGALSLDLFAVLFGGAVALLPIFAKDILHVGPKGLGELRAATSAGGTLMSFFMLHRPHIRQAGKAFFIAVALFGVAMIGFGLSRNFYLSLFFLAMSGAVDNVSMIVRSTIIQSMTPNLMRGRVSAVNGVFIGASNQIGGFESGVTAQMFGTAPSVVIGGFLTLGVVAVSAWKWPEIGRLGSLNEIAKLAHTTEEPPDVLLGSYSLDGAEAETDPSA